MVHGLIHQIGANASLISAMMVGVGLPFCGPFFNRLVIVASSVLGFQNPVMDFFVRNFMKNIPGWLFFNFG